MRKMVDRERSLGLCLRTGVLPDGDTFWRIIWRHGADGTPLFRQDDPKNAISSISDDRVV